MRVKIVFLLAIVYVLGILSYPLFFGAGGALKENVGGESNNESVAAKELKLSGEGPQTLGPFNFSEKLVVLDIKNMSGPNSLFTVSLSTDDNKNGKADKNEGWTGVGLQVGYEEAESFKGSIAFKPADKPYFIYVSGGRWEVVVRELAPLKKDARKFDSFKGSGYAVSEKFYLPEGKAHFRATNKGGGNFIVKLVDENGNASGRLVNEIGDSDVEFTYDVVFPGNYIFTVRSGGDWEITRK